jgi:hypothetical protein
MSVYAVYTRSRERQEWGLRQVFATREAADRFARATLGLAEAGGAEAAVSAAVVEREDRASAPPRLPEPGGASVVARYGQADPARGRP